MLTVAWLLWARASSVSAAASLALPPVQLVYAYEARGDPERMERAISHAAQLTPNPDLRDALLRLRLEARAADSVLPLE